MAAKEKESVKRKTPSSAGDKQPYDKNFKKKQKSIDENKEGLSSSALKRQVRKDRQSTRKHADSVAEAKTLWNKLRLKTNTKKDTEDLMDKVMTLIHGKVKEIALQHDASRVVQAAIQFGNEKQRKEILTEICKSEGSLAEMAKIQYAHFCCLKLIKYCARDDASIKMIVKVRPFFFVVFVVSRRPFYFSSFYHTSWVFCSLHIFLIYLLSSYFILLKVFQGRNAQTCSSRSWSSCLRISFFEFTTETNSHFETRILRSPFQSLCKGFIRCSNS
ncbi:MAG: hypothetical protein ACI8RD_005453 [Bacillariaceae sp.]|jgi:hypothetical protein